MNRKFKRTTFNLNIHFLMNHHEQVLHEYTYTVVTYKYTEMSLR